MTLWMSTPMHAHPVVHHEPVSRRTSGAQDILRRPHPKTFRSMSGWKSEPGFRVCFRLSVASDSSTSNLPEQDSRYGRPVVSLEQQIQRLINEFVLILIGIQRQLGDLLSDDRIDPLRN